ncbi:MAG: hypothetical protein ACLFR1_02740 [Spirochaetia bacterium]
MAEQDFSAKYNQGKGNDEIDSLGSAMNGLSENLNSALTDDISHLKEKSQPP